MKRLRVPDKHGVELAEYTREIVYCLGVGEREREGDREAARTLGCLLPRFGFGDGLEIAWYYRVGGKVYCVSRM